MALEDTNSRIVLPSGEVWSEIYRDGGDYVLDWKRTACFRVARDGSRARCKAYPSASPTSVSVLKDLAKAYADSLHGHESIHATALIPPGASWAVAFLGDSGAGKSTLSAHLVRRDWGLLSDDALSLSCHRGSVWVSSRAQRLKLGEESLKSVGWKRSSAAFDPNLEKWVFSLPENMGNYPLRALFLLSRDKSEIPRLARVQGAEAVIALQAGFYNLLLRPRRVLHRQFDLAARLARAVPIWKLSYPSGLRHLPKVCGFLGSFLNGFHADPSY